MGQKLISQSENTLSNEEETSTEPNSALVRSEKTLKLQEIGNDMLINIINKVELKTFLKLLRTNKRMNHFCQNTNGIKIHFEIEFLQIQMLNGRPRIVCSVGNYAKVVSSLRDLPIKSHLKSLTISRMSSEVLPSIRQALKELSVKSILFFECESIANSHREIIEIVKDYGVIHVRLVYGEGAPMPDELLEALLKGREFPKLFKLVIESSRPVSEDAILNSSLPYLQISASYVSSSSVRQIIKKWTTTSNLRGWHIYGTFDGEAAEEISNSFNALDFHHQGPLPNNRPLFLKSEDFDGESSSGRLFVLCEDGRVLVISFVYSSLYIGYFEMNAWNQEKVPPALKALLPPVTPEQEEEKKRILSDWQNMFNKRISL